MSEQVLKGIRVADFTHAGVGPLTMRALADAGAEVIKIETTTRTEVMRRANPFKKGVTDVEASAHFACYNCNKLGVTLNLRKPKAIELAKELIKTCDVVGESFTPGVMDRLGLGYKDLIKVKPDIIMAGMSLMGQTGPARLYRGHGPVLQAMAGLSELTGWPHLRPMAVSIAYTDYYAPQIWTLAVIGALIYRNKTGKGQYIDGSDFEAAIDSLETNLLDYNVNGRITVRNGNRNPRAAPHGCYPCAGEDRWCAIAVFVDEEWQGLCTVLGNPSWCKEERFSTFRGRLENNDELDDRISAWTRERSAEEVMEQLQKAGVRAGVVQNSRDFHQDPQLSHQKHYWELEDDPDKEWFTYESFGYHLSETPLKMTRPFPHLGEHNYHVFCELLGINDDEFAQLVADGVIE